MNRKTYSFELKMQVVQDYLNHVGGYKYLAQKYEISSHSSIIAWVNKYRTFGPRALIKENNIRSYTSEFKLDVLNYKKHNELSNKEVANHFGITCQSTVGRWERELKRDGQNAFQTTRRGRLKKMTKDNKKNDKPLNESEREELERLRQESRMTELELIILKKLNALPKDPYDKK